MAYNTITNCL